MIDTNGTVIRFPTLESWHAYCAEHRSDFYTFPQNYCKYGCGGAGMFAIRTTNNAQRTIACPCAAERAQRAQEQKYRNNLSNSERAFSLDNWIGADPNALRAAKEASARGWGLLCFYGELGTAKSGLLTAIVNAALDQHTPAIYTVAPTMLRELRAAYDDNSFEATFQNLCAVKVLAIDEMWRYKQTEWAEERMFELMDYRYRYWDRLLTVCATNAHPNPAHDALWSRFTDTVRAQIINVCGGDMRPVALELSEAR